MVSHFSYFKRLLYQPFLSIQSPPAWEVWIEMALKVRVCKRHKSHLPHGRCGLKYKPHAEKNICWKVTSRMGGVDWNNLKALQMKANASHLPHGRCGLKLYTRFHSRYTITSPPVWEVWIEIISRKRLFVKSICHLSRMWGANWNRYSSIHCLLIWLSRFPYGKCGLKPDCGCDYFTLIHPLSLSGGWNCYWVCWHIVAGELVFLLFRRVK